MGSGESAHREAAMVLRLLEKFLRSGIAPAPALKTLNAALSLRGEETGSFTTVDLLSMRQSSGEASLYKYGAAPSYCKLSGSVSRFVAGNLPAGLQSSAPEATRLTLLPGSFFVMISDGVADETDDEWLQNLLAGWDGTDPQALAKTILTEACARRHLGDDCAALVLYLPREMKRKQV
jgi:serine phosphatase RsbU (regulator of sigma subunit)